MKLLYHDPFFFIINLIVITIFLGATKYGGSGAGISGQLRDLVPRCSGSCSYGPILF